MTVGPALSARVNSTHTPCVKSWTIDIVEALPVWAVRVPALGYGHPLPAAGLYFTQHSSGGLAAVGVAVLAPPPSWEPSKDPVVICQMLLEISVDGTTASSRGRTWRTQYEPGGVLRTANGYSEEDDLGQTELTLEAWVRADLAEKIEATRPSGRPPKM